MGTPGPRPSDSRKQGLTALGTGVWSSSIRWRAALLLLMAGLLMLLLTLFQGQLPVSFASSVNLLRRCDSRRLHD